MILSNCILHFDLSRVNFLKGGRAITNSLKEKPKTFKLSVLDVSGEYAEEADIIFAYLSPAALGTTQYREKMQERNFSEIAYEFEGEEL